MENQLSIQSFNISRQLYVGSAETFISDTTRNKIADLLRTEYENYFGYRISPGEYTSWVNSLQFLKNVIQEYKLQDAILALEYFLPYSNQRIDCLLFGRGWNEKDNVIIIELKQWSSTKSCDIEDTVYTVLGGRDRLEPHPSVQVRGYHYYLKDFLKIFQEPPSIELHSAVYCHNYTRKGEDALFDFKFKQILKDFPLFVKDDFERLGRYLKTKLSNGNGQEIFDRFKMSKLQPSKKLVELTKHMINGQSVFNLLDEQITANNTIINRAKKSTSLEKKSVITIKGGPGTGKSMIALNALAELLTHRINVFHATGSSAFTSVLRKVVGTRPAKLFKYFNGFSHKKYAENSIDVLICDEAHRIRITSNSRYTPREFKSEIPQIDELIRVAKVAIFFIDDDQVVRPDEIGNSKLIIETAQKYDAEILNFELQTQFRCNGSNGYLNWIDNILGIHQTANQFLTKNERMEFKIFESPQFLYNAIKEKNEIKPNSARLVAGFCWPWSDAKPDGTLVDDVVIGNFKMTWEAKNESSKLAPGIPLAKYWAYDPDGVNQIGSIYTVQGFEFDYIGVIFGKDMMYDPVNKEWKGYPENSKDPTVKRGKDQFLQLIKNTYRVLMTRGMKGCYVYFVDKETEKFVKSHITFD